MKVILLGASGIIGSKTAQALHSNHEIIRVGRNGDVKVDYTDTRSVKAMFEQVGKFDVLIAVVGCDSAFKPYEDLMDEDFDYGFQRKFMAQINLVRIGIPYANDSGSFTLSSGYLSDYPNPASAVTGPPLMRQSILFSNSRANVASRGTPQRCQSGTSCIA